MTASPAPPRGASRFAVGDRVAGYRVQGVLGEGMSSVVYDALLEPPVVPPNLPAPGSAVSAEASPLTTERAASPEASALPMEPAASPVSASAPRRVALKVIHRHLVRDDQIALRFRREARILRSLSGPHLVRLLDFGETAEGQLYMALERVEGAPLDVLVRREPVGPDRAARLVGQVAAALAVAHAAGVIHRDLKPGNVLVERPGSPDECARVLDFGLAKALRGDASSDSLNALTQANMVFGTPEYMAPEQARGEEIDARCDVYAAGILLYELLSGRVPFSRPSPVATMTAHLAEVPPPLSSPERAVPPALQEVLLHALAKDPAQRYPTAVSLGRALEQARLTPGDRAAVRPAEDPALHDTHLDLAGAARLARSLPPPRRARQVPTWVVVALALLAAVALALALAGAR